MTWLKDGNGNKCSVEYFGSEEAAKKALASLIDCINCSDCSDCSRCSDLKNAAPVEQTPSEAESKPLVPSVPVVENLHQKIYEAVTQPNALEMSTWHTCETTHCRAGWVVALAGSAGKALEQFFNTELAAMKIYDASYPGYKINPVRFYDTNEDALEDMRKLAMA